MAEKRRRDETRLDAAVMNPSDDLLGVNPHAEALARYIRKHKRDLPMVIGIQGEWGEGKTTLVNFLRHHLSHTDAEGRPYPDGKERPIKFVEFSAWPYTTSDKLWRALILKIARVLYKQEKPAPGQQAAANANPQTDDAGKDEADDKDSNGGQGAAGDKQGTGEGAGREPKKGGALYTLSRFLSGHAFVLVAPPRPKLNEVIEELERTNFGQVSRRKADVQLNEDAAMAAVVKGAVAALSTVSPLAGLFRSLFGLDPKEDAARVLQSGGATSGGIDPLEGFRRTFSKLVRDRVPRDEPLYVFIDDLDRAQPDVALDIMEAIRIAFEDDRCIFIIAVDDRLIAEGLWLRYRNLYEKDDQKEQRARFTVKGREYLEKIIQFKMLMPQRAPEQVQRLIAGRYPELAAAGDIVREVGGTNPRRIKQYCEHLLFQKMVGQEAAEAATRQGGGRPAGG